MKSRPAVAFVTLGCPKNEVDTDRMQASLGASFDVVEALEDADVAIVNTCAFIREATEESIAAVLELAQAWKTERDGRSVVVTGCMPSRYGDELASELPEVDAFVPVAGERTLREVVARLTGVSAGGGSAAGGVARTASGPTAYLMISDGCHRRCAFCTIPAIRGPYRSHPLDDILAEARFLVDGGAKELVLIGQDTSAYGRDLGEDAPNLSDVVRSVARVEGLAWLRLMYVQPDGITPELLQTMAAEPTVCRYLDMPLQHASAAVLHRMARPGSGEEYLRLIGIIRGFMPDVCLRTTLIAGFPGETRPDAKRLEDFVRNARFDYVGVFPYSPEEGTAAAAMPDQVPLGTRRARAQRLRDVADEVGFDKAAAYIDATLEVLVDIADDTEEGPIARHRGQAPEVDGAVLLDRALPEGMIARVRVVDALGYDLVGEVL
jgi:ribosomal protein S12 methylthiotransferase